jgi:UDPglucose--hexose-1-phosphate uridylyltransferase
LSGNDVGFWYMKLQRNSPIEFRREVLSSRMMTRNGSGEFSEAAVPLEFRFDPLTGRTCRIVQYSPERIIRPNLTTLERKSKKLTCPFCKPFIEKNTPRFPPDLVPEGVIRKGKAIAFPNLGPYDVYGVVVAISDRHFVPLKDFDTETLHNALLSAQAYIKSVQDFDRRAIYHFIAWNHMPPSGGSIVHPHLQSNAGYFPTDYQAQILEASEKYYQEKGTNYWSDLLKEEKKNEQRYIGQIGHTEWLTSFVPKGRLSDVVVVFPGKASIAELTKRDLEDFARGLIKVFDYIDELKLISFNMSTYSGFDKDRFWAHARITPRGMLLYSPIETSDQFYYQIMQDENICILPPETVAEGLRKRF